MLTVKTIKSDMAVGDSHAAHLINKSGRRVRHRYYTTAAYVYGVGAPHYPVPARCNDSSAFVFANWYAWEIVSKYI